MNDDELKYLAVDLVFNPENLKYLLTIENSPDKCFYVFKNINRLNLTILYYKRPKNSLTFATNKNNKLFELNSDEIRYYKLEILIYKNKITL